MTNYPLLPVGYTWKYTISGKRAHIVDKSDQSLCPAWNIILVWYNGTNRYDPCKACVEELANVRSGN